MPAFQVHPDAAEQPNRCETAHGAGQWLHQSEAGKSPVRGLGEMLLM